MFCFLGRQLSGVVFARKKRKDYLVEILNLVYRHRAFFVARFDRFFKIRSTARPRLFDILRVNVYRNLYSCTAEIANTKSVYRRGKRRTDGQSSNRPERWLGRFKEVPRRCHELCTLCYGVRNRIASI